ncbi:YdcF family protein [Adhaeribacter swui]|uniref:YdcF family protein n=1 Tax=Adhaeribacter swui TaxID=2086471 RepID=A0A7G7G7V1_9BACT|nr:YdcF family protein [Adhaeribacter swui]QNF33235.1 YdcF family protein [Adhaeribacter swui]
MEEITVPGCIMILGAPNDAAGNLSEIATSRLRKGYQELSQHPNFKILLTGGFGPHFNETNLPHYTYAKNYLIKELGVSPEAFLTEAITSANTVEDLEQARLVFQKYAINQIIIVTSEFHVPRVQYIAGKALAQFSNSITYSSAPDKDLDEDLLPKLHEHESRAITYLQLNYHPAVL